MDYLFKIFKIISLSTVSKFLDYKKLNHIFFLPFFNFQGFFSLFFFSFPIFVVIMLELLLMILINPQLVIYLISLPNIMVYFYFCPIYLFLHLEKLRMITFMPIRFQRNKKLQFGHEYLHYLHQPQAKLIFLPFINALIFMHNIQVSIRIDLYD